VREGLIGSRVVDPRAAVCDDPRAVGQLVAGPALEAALSKNQKPASLGYWGLSKGSMHNMERKLTKMPLLLQGMLAGLGPTRGKDGQLYNKPDTVFTTVIQMGSPRAGPRLSTFNSSCVHNLYCDNSAPNLRWLAGSTR